MRTDQKNESAAPIDYVERVNRAIDHIVGNLAEPLRLGEVSEAAGFSPFHFHRVFKSLLGETLNQFVNRLRLERALYLMSHVPNRSLTDVALDCGFSSSSDFSRSFKQCYGAAPNVFDLDTFRNSRREEFERVLSSQEGGRRFTTLPAGENPDGFEVQLRDLPARTVAYIRVLDPYREGVAQAACERPALDVSSRRRSVRRLQPQRAIDRRPLDARFEPVAGKTAIRLANVVPPRYAFVMRPLRYSINVTLDGCCDHRGMSPDEDMHRHAVENLDQADALLFGRVTYEMMEAAFRSPARTVAMPDWMKPFARTIDAAKKYVVSSTLDRVDWNAELVRGDLGQAVQQLKRESGKGLLVGGVKLPQALAELGLIDEYEFVMQPRLAGHGPTLFAGLSKRVDLRLAGRLEFGSGAVAMRYEPRR